VAAAASGHGERDCYTDGSESVDWDFPRPPEMADLLVLALQPAVLHASWDDASDADAETEAAWPGDDGDAGAAEAVVPV